MAEYLIAYYKTMKDEGGYANDPDDIGGETWKGIARKYHPNWPGWKIVDDLRHTDGFPKNLNANAELEKHVKDFYRDQYWDRMRLGEIAVQEIADQLFNFSINVSNGTVRVIEFLQDVVNLCNSNQKLYPDIPVDGLNGARTIQALQACLAHRPVWMVLWMIRARMTNYHMDRMRESPIKEKWAMGWMKRDAGMA